ncbi:MAG: hypothetical protein Q8Q85_06490 [Gemmatimonadales bacterium]|nr:hypothetical protein [Gemmatimonadales bacterium]
MTWAFAPVWNGALTYDRFVKESTEHCGDPGNRAFQLPHRTARAPYR